RVAHGRHLRAAERDHEIELLLPPLCRVRQSAEQVEALAKMRRRFNVARTFERLLSRHPPVGGGLLRVSRLPMVVREQVRLTLAQPLESAFEGLRKPVVILPSLV